MLNSWKYWCVFLLVGIPISNCIAQADSMRPYRKAFTFITDNDLYALQFKDGYYSNGLFLNYAFLKPHKKYKKITHWELGQKIYTQHDRREFLRGNEIVDRPYFGILYLGYGNTLVRSNTRLTNYKIWLGVTGDLSFSRQLQAYYHQLIGLHRYNNYPFWKDQIENSVGINADFMLAQTIAKSSWLSIIPTAQVSMGMFANELRLGSYICLGPMQALGNSLLMQANLGNTNKQKEFFVYTYPELSLQVYNASTQGTLFYHPSAHVFTAKPCTFMYRQQLGAVYQRNRWLLKIYGAFESKEAQTQITHNWYGSLSLGYQIY